MILRVKKLLMVLLAGVLALSMGVAIAMNMPMVKADGEATLSISMEKGLSVRTEDPIGIRFRTKVNIEYVEANQDNIEIVVMITPTRNIADKTFDANFDGENKKVVFSKENGNLVNNGDYEVPGDATNYWYHACITGLQEQNIARDFSAISYVLYDGVLLENSYTDIAQGNAWNSAKEYLKDDTVIKTETDIANAQALCASNIATITGFDGETYDLTVKRGQTVAQAANENEEAIKAALDVEGCAYYNTLPESANVTLTEDAEFTAIMNKLEFVEVAGGYEVNAGNIMYLQPEKIIVPETFNGKPVVAVGQLAFSSGNANSCIKYIKLPESVTLVKYHAFAECKALETLIMPGINISTYNPPEDAGFHSDTRSANLKHVVVGAGFAVVAFNGSDGRFLHPQLTSPEADIAPADPNNEIRQADIYVYGSECGGIDVTNNTALKVYTNTRYGGQGIFYSATEKVGCWYYDENGIPAIWEDKTVYELNSTSDGYILTHFAEKDVVDGKVIIPDTYNDLPVVAVGDYAFGAIKTIKYLSFPVTVTKIGVDALAKLSNLETLIMPGITGGLWGSKASLAFGSDIKSDVLKHVVVGVGFNVNSVDSSMPRFMNSHLVGPAADVLPEDSDNQYRTAELYYYGTTGILVDVTNNTAFKVRTNARYSDCYYTYSETPVANGWYYNDNDIPTPWTGAAYAPVDGGYEVSMYITSGETRVEIPATYNGLPVVSVGANAFGSSATVETLILPESVTKVGAGAVSGLSNLKHLVMPGVRDSANFKDTVTAVTLETIVTGGGFIIGTAMFHNPNGQNKAKLIWADMPLYDLDDKTGLTYTSFRYPKPISVGDVSNCKLLSGEAYGYKGNGEYVLLELRVKTATFVVPESINDFVNGEGKVTEVASQISANQRGMSGFDNRSSSLVNLILPESVVKIGYHAFIGFNSLETLVMPGITNMSQYSGGSALRSKVLKSVVVGEGCNITDNFAGGDAGYFTDGSVDLYVYGDGSVVSTISSTQKQMSMNIYYYSAIRSSGAWTYVNGIPTLWDNIA